MAGGVIARKALEEARVMFPKQACQPVAGETPEPIAASVARAAEELPEAGVVGVNGIGALGQFGDPGTRESGVEPAAGFFPDGSGDAARDNGSVFFDFETL